MVQNVNFRYVYPGGIMGLFSGMSIISLAEMTFWLMRFVSRWIGNVSNES